MLNGHQIEDVEAHLAGEDEEQARRFGWYPAHSTRETVLAAIRRWQAAWQSAGATRAFALRLEGSGALAGGCEVRVQQDGNAGMSYWVFPAYRRRGLATRAARLACDWAFAALGVERLELEIEPDNIASRGVAVRAGFTQHGRLPGAGPEGREMLRYVRRRGEA